MIEIVGNINGSPINKEEARLIKRDVYNALATVSFYYSHFEACDLDFKKIVATAKWVGLSLQVPKYREVFYRIDEASWSLLFSKAGRLYQFDTGKKVHKNSVLINQ